MPQTVQIANALLPKFIHRPRHRSQRRIDATGQLNVVMPGDGNIAGYSNAAISKRMNQRNRIDVIPAEHGRRPVVQIEELIGYTGRTLQSAVKRENQVGIVVETRRFQRLPVRQYFRLAPCSGRTAYETDTFVAELQQVVHYGNASLQCVAIDMVSPHRPD